MDEEGGDHIERNHKQNDGGRYAEKQHDDGHQKSSEP